jgi:hypothetical protein
MTWVVMGIALFIAVVQLFTGFLRSNGYESRFMALLGYFDANGDSTFNAWFSSLLIAGAGVGAAAASMVPTARVRRGFIALSVLLFYLSLDKATSLHQLIAHEMPKFIDVDDRKWTVTGLVLVLIGVVYLLGLLRGIPWPPRFGLILGAAIFMLGAVVFDFAGGVANEINGSGGTLDLFSIAEELAEVTGMVIVARTCFLIVRHGLGGFAVREIVLLGRIPSSTQK